MMTSGLGRTVDREASDDAVDEELRGECGVDGLPVSLPEERCEQDHSERMKVKVSSVPSTMNRTRHCRRVSFPTWAGMQT